MREDEDEYHVSESMAARQVREAREGLYTANRISELREELVIGGSVRVGLR